MRPIPKSDRESNRYIACVISATNPISYNVFSRALEEKALELVGKFGIGALGLQVIEDQYKFPRITIKTVAGQDRIVRAIVCAMTHAGEQQIRVTSTKTSGTLKNVIL